jgi:hypothetical protein
VPETRSGAALHAWDTTDDTHHDRLLAGPSMSLLATHSAKHTQAERVGLTEIGVVVEGLSSAAEKAV